VGGLARKVTCGCERAGSAPCTVNDTCNRRGALVTNRVFGTHLTLLALCYMQHRDKEKSKICTSTGVFHPKLHRQLTEVFR
jgi:hypothetical protein